jgi:arylsulfatase A-like enzyme
MIKHVAISVALVLFTIPSSARAAERKPNIIFFLVDDMGWQETSVPFHTEVTALNRRYRTPNMERLAADGVKFTQAYASAVCSPTRISALTGMNVARHRVTNWTLRRNVSPDASLKNYTLPVWNMNGICVEPGVERTIQVTPLPALLHAAGYRTIHVGKGHFGAKDTPGANPRNLGFDVNIGGSEIGGPGSYWGEKNFSAEWRGGGRGWDVQGLEAYHGQDIHLTEALTLEAIRAVEQSVADSQPFYLYMSHYAVHMPLEKDERFYEKYIAAGLKPHDAAYASIIEGMDKSLGDLMATVKRLGIEDNTIILFMADNGSIVGAPNAPLRGRKLTPYEGGIREPMIVKWPGVTKPGTTCRDTVVIEDFFPTILELAGATGKTLQTVDGVSFVPLLKGTGRTPADRAFVWHFPNNYYGQTPFSAIRIGPWKLIYHHVDRRLELFNIDDDISEQTNLAAEEPGKVKELATRLTQLLKERGAQMPSYHSTGKSIEWPDQAKDNLPIGLDELPKSDTPPSAAPNGSLWLPRVRLPDLDGDGVFAGQALRG